MITNSLKKFVLVFLTYRQAEFMRTSLAVILYYSGIALSYKLLFPKKGAVILVYHSINNDTVFRDNIVFPEIFEKQLKYIRKRYKIVPLSTLVQAVRTGREIPDDWVVLTFDDSYADNLENAMPLLKKYKASATFFITLNVVGNKEHFFYDAIQAIIDRTEKKEIRVDTGRGNCLYKLSSQKFKNEAVLRIVLSIREKAREEQEQLIRKLAVLCGVNEMNINRKIYLNMEDIKMLSEFNPADGIMEIGSHTLSHINLKILGQEELEREIAGSARILEEITGTRPDAFSYPFGKRHFYNRKVKNVVKESGYQSALTTVPGKVTSGVDIYQLPRIGARNSLTGLKVNLMGIMI